MEEEQIEESDLVLTDAAVLSPLGIGFNAFKNALDQGKTTFAPITLFTETNQEVVMGGEVWDFDARSILGRKGLRTLDRNTCLVLACIQKDFKDLLTTVLPEEIGLVIGTNFGSLPSLEHFTKTYLQEGFRALNPSLFPNLVINSPPSQGNIRFNLTASSTTLANGATSGLDAIQFAANCIEQGMGDCFLCGASEELSYSLCYAMKQHGQITDQPTVQPFAKPSRGTLPSEGTALFVLETYKHAITRGATVIAKLKAWSSCYGGSWAETLKPSAKAGAHVIKQTLREANLPPEALSFISVSANGWQKRDQAEYEALKQALGKMLPNIPIIAPASYWGDAGAASSALQMAASLANIQAGILLGHPSLQNTDVPEELWLSVNPEKRKFEHGLILSLGDTGAASAILLSTPGANCSR